MTNQSNTEPADRSVNMKVTDSAANALAILMCAEKGKTRDHFVKRAVFLIKKHGWDNQQ